MYLDLARLAQKNKPTTYPIINLKLAKGVGSEFNPIWHEFSAEVFQVLGLHSFPSASEVATRKTSYPHVRIVYSSMDGVHPIKQGSGIFTLSAIAFHATKIIPNAQILRFTPLKGGIPEIIKEYETTSENEPVFIRPSPVEWIKIIQQSEKGSVRVFCLYQDSMKGRPRLLNVIRLLAQVFHQEEEVNNLGDNQLLSLGPFEICFLKFPPEGEYGLFQNIYLGTRQEAESLVNIYLPAEFLNSNLRQVALVETSWTRRVAKRRTNAKLLFREVLAKKDIASQFLDVKRKEKYETNLNALYELYRLAGLPLCPIKIDFLPENVWSFGINIFEIQKKGWGGVIIATLHSPFSITK